MVSVLIWTILIIFGAVVLFFAAATIYAAVIGASFVATPKKAIRKALEIVVLKPGEKFYDLGSGNGRALIIAAKEFGADAKGFELSPQHYLISKINIFLRGCSKNAKVFWKNFYGEDLSGADVLFLWLTPRGNKKLEEKFKKELKVGTRVVIYSSPLLFWEPENVIEFPGGGKLFLYIKK